MKFRHAYYVIGAMMSNKTTIGYVTDGVNRGGLVRGRAMLAVLIQWPSVILSKSFFNITVLNLLGFFVLGLMSHMKQIINVPARNCKGSSQVFRPRALD